MFFTVVRKELLTEKVINEESCNSLKAALESAAAVTLKRSVAITISVTDERGRVHFRRVVPADS